MKKAKTETAGRRFRRVAPERVASREDLAGEKTKVRITIMLDLDVLNHFKARAAVKGAPPYQTQINQALRHVMEGGMTEARGLLDDERFIRAVASRVAQLK